MRMSLEEETRMIAKEMVKNLSKLTLFDKSDKERFQDVLAELEDDGEIFGFIVEPNRKFKDFAVIVEKEGKRDTVGVVILKKEKEIKKYMARQDQLRKQIGQYRKFVERIIIVVNSTLTNEDLKRQWQKAIKQHQES